MGEFQTMCAEIPRWNQDVIEANIATMLDSCRCDYIEDLMTAVFIAHTKMLTAIRVNSQQKKLQITLPKLDHFLHRVFTECARSFWKAPFLFSEEYSPVERQKNILQAETLCAEALSAAVRSLLPVKNILRDYLKEDDDEDEEVAEAATAEVAEESEADEVPEIAAPKKKKKSVESTPIDLSEVVVPSESAAPPVTPLVAETPAPVVAETPAPPVTPIVTVTPAPSVIPLVSETPAPSSTPIVAETSVELTAPIAIEPVKQEKQEKQEPLLFTATSELPVKEPVSLDTIERNEMKNTSVHLTKIDEPITNVKIETEPSVHFTPYDTVFDETTKGISEIRYTPKISVEDIVSDVPRLQIGGGSSSLSISDLGIEALDERPKTPEDIDVALSSSLDFETLS